MGGGGVEGGGVEGGGVEGGGEVGAPLNIEGVHFLILLHLFLFLGGGGEVGVGGGRVEGGGEVEGGGVEGGGAVGAPICVRGVSIWSFFLPFPLFLGGLGVEGGGVEGGGEVGGGAGWQRMLGLL